MKFDFEKDKLIILLILADLSFIVLHILHIYTNLLPDDLFSIAQERGYGEFFQYTKELWIASLFLIFGFKKRKLQYLIFSLLFLYFLVDDSFEFHERLGASLAYRLNVQPYFGLRAKDFGELAVSAFFGAFFLISIAIVYYRSDAFTRTVSRYVLGMVFTLAFFGIIVDMIGIIIKHPVLNPIINTIEDGGEMMIMSLITWFVFRLSPASDEIPIFESSVRQRLQLEADKKAPAD